MVSYVMFQGVFIIAVFQVLSLKEHSTGPYAATASQPWSFVFFGIR